MKHPFSLEKYFSFLNTQSIILSDHQKDQFKAYQKLLKAWSGKQNLVSRADVFHLVERHFLPSALLSFSLPDIIKGKLIDIGTGAGFPGVILKILRPELSLTLLDSSRKKVLFLEEVREQLKLEFPILCQRAEEYRPKDEEKYYIVISRAVGSLDLLWRLSLHLIKFGGSLYALKGGDFQSEIDEIRSRLLKIDIISPDEAWLKVSNYLDHKYIIKLEK